MLEKLTWANYGLMFFAGFIVSACGQEAREPVKVGTAQAELHSELVFPEALDAPAASDQFEDPMPSPRHITLSEPENHLQDRAHRTVKRYEFLPAPVKPQGALKNSNLKSIGQAHSSLADKHQVRAGKGFGVEAMISPGKVSLDHISYYAPAMTSKPYPKVLEHLKPTLVPFKSSKPLVFHRGATGFAHQPPASQVYPDSPLPAQQEWDTSPLPETRVYLSSKPRTHVTLVPSKNRLDLMNDNPNLIRDRFYKLH